MKTLLEMDSANTRNEVEMDFLLCGKEVLRSLKANRPDIITVNPKNRP